MASFWKKISYIGIDPDAVLPHKDVKKMIFFNQVLFVGFFGALLQVIMVWPIVGVKAIVFSIVPLVSIASLLLNKKGKVKLSRVLFIYTVYGLGLVTVLMLGGSGLYHIGVFSTFTFGLILFDIKTEKVSILLGIPMALLVIAIGEFKLFGTPDFSKHFITPYFRIANITSLVVVNSILTIFILKLNKKTENDLSQAIQEKVSALNELIAKKKELENQKDSLEKMVITRTFEISNQKDTLETQNREKEILLQEVHHRVKNNLQIIISLINLQLSKIDNSEAIDALQEIQSRVQSMSLVHRKMYETSNFAEIKLKDYCDQLVDNIQLLYTEKTISFKNVIPFSLTIDMEIAIPFGLILNEIIVNFYKHGYDNNRSDNEFVIELTSENKDFIEIKCSDNGPGFSDEALSNANSSLGLEIIGGLVEQVDGVFSYFNDQGAAYSFTVKTK